MFRSSLPLLFLIRIVSPFPWQGPRQTESATSTANWTPVPTSGSNEDISFLELIRRDIYPVSVCGWIGGDVAQPAYCSTQSSCVWNSDYGIVGCCATASSNCEFYTSCVDMNSPKQVGDSGNVFTCRGTSVCYSNTYPGDYKQWGCGSSDWATDVETSYAGMAADISLQIVFTGSAAQGSGIQTTAVTTTQEAVAIIPTSSSSLSPQVAVETSSSEGASPASASVLSSATSSSSSSTSTSTSSSSLSSSTNSPTSSAHVTSTSSVPVGAVAGGAVGGVALIALVAVLCFFRRRHNKSKSRNMHVVSNNQPMKDIGFPSPASREPLVPPTTHHTSGSSTPQSHQPSQAASEPQYDKRGVLIEHSPKPVPGSARSNKTSPSGLKKSTKPKTGASAGSGAKKPSRPKAGTAGPSSST
ncbi:hypothetical protein BP6252_13274 [Coleophoma cylindrospora]|uniref:Mid2 domain-containing protein n=1 Tax=Coleophoma cylindrospora TaxID=1849047 RepID=A0A3D8QB18_9HELO|nr:hypothetical protein BP6252_13274 [Coleophoma cylindrospora]